MRRLARNIGLSLALGFFVGAIAACNNGEQGTAEVVAPAETDATITEPADAEENIAGAEAAADGDATPKESEPAATANASSEPVRSQATNPPPPLPAECSNPQTQQAMNLCAKATYDRADAELNTTYQAVKRRVGDQKADQLETAEQAWIEFRDSYCDFVQAQYEGGSIQPMVHHGCLTLLTKDRTEVLAEPGTASVEYDAADQALNSVYQNLQDYLNSTDQGLLTDAQLAWLDYRDLHCAFEGGDTNACLAQVTEVRTRQLREQLDTRSL